MSDKVIHKLLSYSLAVVWIVNGLFCKVLDLVPRHEKIVGRILGADHARLFTIAVGSAEIFMAIWILSSIKTRLNTILQILVVAIMNSLEFILVPDLLLWGKWNSLFAFIFILVVYFNEFQLNKKSSLQT